MYKYRYLTYLVLLFATSNLYSYMPPTVTLPHYSTLVHTRARLEKKLFKTLKKAQTNLVVKRIAGIQSLLAKLIVPLGKLALQCLQLYKFKEASSLIQVIKYFAHTTLVALKHITLIRVISTVAHILTALHSNAEHLRKNIHKLIYAYKKNNYNAFGKIVAHIIKILVGRTLARDILHTSFNIAHTHNLNSHYIKALLHGVRHTLQSKNN